MSVFATVAAAVTITAGVVGIVGASYKAGQKAKTMTNTDQTLKQGHKILHTDMKEVMKAVEANGETSLEQCPICGESGSVDSTETKTKKKQKKL